MVDRIDGFLHLELFQFLHPEAFFSFLILHLLVQCLLQLFAQFLSLHFSLFFEAFIPQLQPSLLLRFQSLACFEFASDVFLFRFTLGGRCLLFFLPSFFQKLVFGASVGPFLTRTNRLKDYFSSLASPAPPTIHFPSKKHEWSWQMASSRRSVLMMKLMLTFEAPWDIIST